MATLTNKQKEDLNKALLHYLNSYPLTKQVFQEEAALHDTDAVTDDVIQKKWISIARLQKKIMDLEEQNESLKTQIPTKTKTNSVVDENLPAAPEIKILEGHRATITHINFHPIYTLLASSSEDGTIKIWDFDSGKLERTLKGHTETVNQTAYSKKGALLASCSADITIKIWSCDTYECTKTFSGHTHNISSVSFIGEDKLVSASRDKLIKIWEVSSGNCLNTLTGHSEWVREVVVDESNELIGSCSSDQTIMVWVFNSTNAAATLSEHTHVIECLQFANSKASQVILKSDYAPKGSSNKFLASGSRDKLVKIWDAVNMKCIVTLNGHDTWVRGIAFHPQGKHLLSCSDDKSIIIWDLSNAKLLKRLSGAHSHFITSISMSMAYPVMATGGVDMLIKIWSCK